YSYLFFAHYPPTPAIYPLSLHDALPIFEAVYEFPFLAHATMEPMNITVHAREGEAEVWAPTQSPDWVQGTVAKILGVPPAKVARSEEHTSELQSRGHLVCRLLLEKKNKR